MIILWKPWLMGEYPVVPSNWHLAHLGQTIIDQTTSTHILTTMTTWKEYQIRIYWFGLWWYREKILKEIYDGIYFLKVKDVKCINCSSGLSIMQNNIKQTFHHRHHVGLQTLAPWWHSLPHLFLPRSSSSFRQKRLMNWIYL